MAEVPVLAFEPTDGSPSRSADRGGIPGGAVAIDLPRLVTSRLGIVANSGGGKSWALRYLLEGTWGRIQQVVLDWEGEFASLRERFGYVLAGHEGDVPARPETAGPLGRRLLELNASAVLDLSDLSIEDRQAFAAAFVGELMAVPRTLWRPLLVVIDEAHMLCPEKGEEEAASKPAVVALAGQGRKRGFCAVLATQRVSHLANSALAEMQNWLIGPTGYEPDVKRAGDQLGFSRREREALKRLEPGQFYARGPAISRDVVLVRTGPVLTSHPEPGQIAPPAPPPPEAIRALLGQLADLPAATVEASDPATSGHRYELEAARARERQHAVTALRVLGMVGSVNGAVDRLEARLIDVTAELEALRAVVLPTRRKLDTLAGIARAISSDATTLESALARFGEAAPLLTDESSSPPRDGSEAEPACSLPPSQAEQSGSDAAADVDGCQPSAPAAAPPRPVRRTVPRETSSDPDPERPTNGLQQRILDELAAFEALGLPAVPRSHLANAAGYAASTKTYLNAQGGLHTAGLIAYLPGTRIGLTTAGRARALVVARPTSLTALHERWRQRLGGLRASLLQALLREPGRPIGRADLAVDVGYAESTKAFVNALGSLHSLGLVEYRKPRLVAASALLVPMELPS